MRKDYLRDWDDWNRVAVKLYYRAKNEAAPREVHNLLSLYKQLDPLMDPQCTKILDVGAGWGRHSIELAKNGFRNVTAIDASPYMEDLFRREAISSAIDAPPAYVVCDFLECAEQPEPAHDLILVLWSMFGVCRHDDINCEFLSKSSRLLKRGGRIVIETVLQDRLHDVFQTSITVKSLFTFDSSESQAEHWEIVDWEGERFLILGSAQFSEDKSVVSYSLQELALGTACTEKTLPGGTIHLKYYDLRALLPMLYRAGFAVEAVAGPLLDPGSRRSARATIIAKRLE